MTSERGRRFLSGLRQLEYTVEATGFARVEHFLAAAEVEHLNSAIDSWTESFRGRHGYTPMKFPFIDLDPDFFLEVMADELIVALGTHFLGAAFRFDHPLGIQQPAKFQRKNGSFIESDAGNLHGGPFSSQGAHACSYINGKPRFGQFNVGLVLKAQGPKTGGLCYVPGSHHVSSPAHDGADVLRLLGGDYGHQMLVVPQLEPGDLVIFPEGLVHGNAPWTEPTNIRRTLYYRYSPGFVAWQPYEKIARYVKMAKTEVQRRLLRAPYVAVFDEEPTISTYDFRAATMPAEEP